MSRDRWPVTPTSSTVAPVLPVRSIPRAERWVIIRLSRLSRDRPVGRCLGERDVREWIADFGLGGLQRYFRLLLSLASRGSLGNQPGFPPPASLGQAPHGEPNRS